MILAPATWYATVPGVTLTGPYNHHFIVDVGLAYLVSGLGLMAAVRLGDRRLAWLASAWPLSHASFHILLWLTHGLPHGAALSAELIGVLGTALLAVFGAGGLPGQTRARGKMT
ncbi:MAG: hypothetical protein JWR10_1293 [Rubritepida sp.]|nr:hypothetical protein [Rubritepida sp.]